MSEAHFRGTLALVGAASALQVLEEEPAEVADVAERALADVEALAVEPVVVPARCLKSELDGATDRQWTDFVLVMRTAQPGSVSASNDLGMFEMRPRRLADLGLFKNVRKVRSESGRMAWVGDWVKPMTEKKFLASPEAQYRAFVASMRKYVDGVNDGSISMPDGGWPEDLTWSGALAILHRCGPSGLRTWNDEGDRFPSTVALAERANGIF